MMTNKSKRYYYIIAKDDLVFEMVKESSITCQSLATPSFEEVIKHKERMRFVMDADSMPNQGYFIVKMGLDFSTPFQGLPSYTESEIIMELQKSKWEHNQMDL